MGLGKEEEANFICHVEDLELLRKIVQNRNTAKRTIDSFRIGLWHYLPGPPKDDLILYGTVPLFDFAVY